MEPWHLDDQATIYHGDCLEVLRGLPDASVDSVVTDPPYGLEFMGKDWDAPWKGKPGRDFNELEPGTLGGFTQLPNHSRVNNVKCGACQRWKFSSNPCKCAQPDFPNARLDAMLAFQLWSQEWAAECLRVLKPGGHLLAFGGTRTWHRLAVAIEDAGFEIRDSIAWMYGSGFPKSLDVSKAIDKAAGAERTERINPRWADRYPNGNGGNHNRGPGGIYGAAESVLGRPLTTSDPATPDAARWQGWGTALKPAHEPVVVARKPLTGTVAGNVLEHGTGALNIDGCRIGYASDADKSKALAGDAFKRKDTSDKGWSRPWMEDPERVAQMNREAKERAQAGRWPANVVLDEDQAAALDKQSGQRSSPAPYVQKSTAPKIYGPGAYLDRPSTHHGDTGGASRFFYVAKAPARERPKVDGIAHPTVKPLTLMRWLCRLVTPPGGTVLEPFAGSGTTIEAALMEGFRVVAIEREPDYLPLIAARLERVAQEPDDGQLTFDASA